MTQPTLFVVIMAGGRGTRLWPRSRALRPKQLLPLAGGRTMLQATADRLEGLVGSEQIVVVTNREYVDEVRLQLPDVPAGQVLGEPEGLGTAAAVALGTALVHGLDPTAIVACLPADHVIETTAGFQATLADAAQAAAAGHAVVIGIPPTGPETGYGYIEIGEPLSDLGPVHRVVSFKEKPDQAAAATYLAGGSHLWNAGMFIWSTAVALAEYDAHLPQLGAQMRDLASHAHSSDFAERIETIWPEITDKTTVDFGILEHSGRVVCVPARFTWNDVGSWAALGDVLPEDEHGNVVVGAHVGVDTTGSILVGAPGRTLATIGLAGMVIVDAGDVVLVCPRDRSQDVRLLVEAVRSAKRSDLL